MLSNLHNKTSLHHLPLEGKGKIGGKHLSFCPFCLYTGSNDQTYMNHIICGHYDAMYGCGKCLDKVTVLGQQMSNHFKHCKGLKEKSVGPEKVGNNVVGPSGDVMAGRSRDRPKKKKKKKTKSHKKSPEVLPPTGSVVSPCHSAHTATEKPYTGAEEMNPKTRSPVRSGKHSSKHGKDGGEKLTKKSEKDMPKKNVPMKGTAQKGRPVVRIKLTQTDHAKRRRRPEERVHCCDSSYLDSCQMQ